MKKQIGELITTLLPWIMVVAFSFLLSSCGTVKEIPVETIDKIECTRVAQIFVDWAVNSGVKTAIKAVQKIVGTTPDGIMGPITLKAINTYGPHTLFDKIKEARIKFYEDIVEENPSQKVFLKGWLNRIDEFKWCD